MVDSGSPVTIFEVDDIKKSWKERHYSFENYQATKKINRRKLNLLGYIFCQLEVGNSKLQKARILVAEKGAK